MTFFTLKVFVSLYSRILMDNSNLILAFRGVVLLNVGSWDLIPCELIPVY